MDSNLSDITKIWKQVLESYNSKKIVELYSKEAILLGTFSNNIRYTTQEIIDYFNEFVRKKPKVIFEDVNINCLGDEYSVINGNYNFTIIENNNVIRIIYARYTFVLIKIDNVWKIQTHHSSIRPN